MEEDDLAMDLCNLVYDDNRPDQSETEEDTGHPHLQHQFRILGLVRALHVSLTLTTSTIITTSDRLAIVQFEQSN